MKKNITQKITENIKIKLHFLTNIYHSKNENRYRNYQCISQRQNKSTRIKQALPKEISKRKKTSYDCNSSQPRCLICTCIYHFAQNYLVTKKQDTAFHKLRNLLSEPRHLAILDSGATETASEESWMNIYIEKNR